MDETKKMIAQVFDEMLEDMYGRKVGFALLVHDPVQEAEDLLSNMPPERILAILARATEKVTDKHSQQHQSSGVH